MGRLFVYLLILGGAVLAALFFNQQEGYVLLSVGPWRVEMSLLFSAVVLGTLVLLLYLGLGTLSRLWGMPRRLRLWQGQRRQESARTELTSGLLRFAEGDYDAAEQQLVRSARRSASPLVNLLIAAIAAQRRGAQEARDSYLGTAEGSNPEAHLGIRMMQAQLQADAGQWEEAQANTAAVLDREPKHRGALELMVACCQALGDWERLGPLLSRIERQGVLPRQELRELNRWVARERLAHAADQGPDALQEAWQDLSRGLRKDPEVTCAYVDGLIHSGQPDAAETLIQKQLSKAWDPELLQRYARLPAADTATHEARLAKVKEWLKGHGDEPDALYAAGVLARQADQWGLAQDYLQAAIDQEGRPEYLHTLAALQEDQGDLEDARASYRLAAEAASAAERALPGAPGLRGPVDHPEPASRPRTAHGG